MGGAQSGDAGAALHSLCQAADVALQVHVLEGQGGEQAGEGRRSGQMQGHTMLLQRLVSWRTQADSALGPPLLCIGQLDHPPIHPPTHPFNAQQQPGAGKRCLSP